MRLPWRRCRREPEEVTAPDDVTDSDDGTAPGDARRALVMGLPVVPLRHHGRLEPVEEGDVLVSVDVGPDGRAVALWSPPAGRDKLRSVAVGRGGARFPVARTRTRVAARVVVHDPQPSLLTSVRNLEVAHPFVQPLPGDRALLVGARCNWRAGGPDRNAQVVGSDGRTVATATFGDGISHVIATPSGQIWVGYFDEGVYGNYGWAGPGPEPIGAPGIVRWGPDLEVAWRYDGEFGGVSDCYALNVDGEGAWAYYYYDFPVVKVVDDRVSGWRSEVEGAHSLVAAGSSVALLGGYGPEWDRVVAGELAGDAFEPRFTGRLVLDDGAELPYGAAFGRGPDLHVFVGTEWYLDDLRRPR